MTTGSLFCRKCLRVEAGHYWAAVSRTGPTSPPSSTSQDLQMGSNSAFAIVVIALAVSGLLCLCTLIWICSRSAASEITSAAARTSTTDEPVVAAAMPKNGPGDEASDDGSKWRAQSVELVVMAGEDVPTFLAHPASSHSKANVIENPPLQL